MLQMISTITKFVQSLVNWIKKNKLNTNQQIYQMSTMYKTNNTNNKVIQHISIKMFENRPLFLIDY